jgi:hypothetical protein
MMKKQSNGKPKRKNGRPRKLTAKLRAEILAIIAEGGSRADAAAYVRVVASTIQNEGDRNPEFLEGLTRAEIDCKMKHIGVLNNADDWRASLALLSRKYPDEWAEHRHIDHQHSVDMDAKGIRIVNDDNWFDVSNRFANEGN